VWNLCFCRAHFAEAEAAALQEILEDDERQLELLAGLENERHHTNPILARFLEDAPSITEMRSRHEGGHQEALREAYKIVEGRIDPVTLAFDYESEYAKLGPVDWWWETHWLLTRFMRLAQERGYSELIKMLEPVRERACAQVVLAEEDCERRQATVRRAKGAAEAIAAEPDGG
jgi:hypothetical protein